MPIRLLPLWFPDGVQLKSPLSGSMLAPVGAPATRPKVGGLSVSLVTVAVKKSSEPAATLVLLIGARYGGLETELVKTSMTKDLASLVYWPSASWTATVTIMFEAG